MKMRPRTRNLALLAVAALAVVACSDDDDDVGDGGSTTEAPGASDAVTAPGATATPGSTSVSGVTTTGGSGATVDLTGVCPDPIVIQADWYPESEHGALYEMVGEGYEVDTAAKVVTGPLVAGGEETGISVEVRTGGPAIGFNPVSVTQYTDESIHLGYANTEGQVVRVQDTPVISVVAPLEINPQIIYWDPETYPDVETLADLGEEGVTINYFEGGRFADVFVGNGTWTRDQLDPSYDGLPGRFIAEDGAIAQQGFASAEPFTYENVFEEWGRPVRYQTLHDAGFEVYSQTLAVKPDDLEELSPCLERFVPIVQQAQVDFVNAPDRATAIIIDAVEQFASEWVYDEALGAYSVETQLELGFVGNGPDDTLGNMEEERIQTVIDQIRDDAGLDVPEDLVASDLFTNEFIDESIGL